MSVHVCDWNTFSAHNDGAETDLHSEVFFFLLAVLARYLRRCTQTPEHPGCQFTVFCCREYFMSAAQSGPWHLLAMMGAKMLEPDEYGLR